MYKIGRIAWIVLGIFAILLIATNGIQSFYRNKIEYETVVYDEIFEYVDTFGIILREEKMVGANLGNYTDIVLNSGDKVAKGDTIANIYTDNSHIFIESELEELYMMREILSETTSSVDNSVKTSLLINDGLVNFNASLDENDITQITDNSDSIKLLSLRNAFGSMTESQIMSEIDSISSQITEKERILSSSESKILAEYAGFFISGVDGYENMSEPTVSEIEKLDGTLIENVETKNILGKIVTSYEWYYTCAMSAEDAEIFEKEKYVDIIFSSSQDDIIEVYAEKVVYDEEKAVVYFKGDTHYDYVLNMRTSEARIILDSHYGIKIPKEATRVVDGTLGVYMASGPVSVFKTIEPIYEEDDFYVAKIKETGTSKDILEGDKIIIS